MAQDFPERIFKLAIQSEVNDFRANNSICSGLDKQDGFIHCSDRNSAPIVASLFFKEEKELILLEIDALQLPGSIEWVVGKLGDPSPVLDKTDIDTIVHYLLPDGCVHVYGPGGVPASAIVRQESVPLNDKNIHVFPTWL